MAKMVLITSTPPGEAPESVRQAWVGLKIPLDEDQSQGTVRGALGGNPEPDNLDGYCVPAGAAIAALKAAGKVGSVHWWVTKGYGFPGQSLMVGKKFCKLVEE